MDVNAVYANAKCAASRRLRVYNRANVEPCESEGILNRKWAVDQLQCVMVIVRSTIAPQGTKMR